MVVGGRFAELTFLDSRGPKLSDCVFDAQDDCSILVLRLV